MDSYYGFAAFLIYLQSLEGLSASVCKDKKMNEAIVTLDEVCLEIGAF